MPAKKSTPSKKTAAKKATKVKAPAKKLPQKPVAKKQAVKKAAATKPATKNAAATKPATKKSAAGKAPVKKSAAATLKKKATVPVKKTTVPAKKAPAKKPAAKKAVKPKAESTAKASKSASKSTPATVSSTAKVATPKAEGISENPKPIATITRSGTPENGKPSPIVFSLDDIEQLMASKKGEPDQKRPAFKKSPKVLPVKKAVVKPEPVPEKPAEKRVLGAASLADILGFNPAEKKKSTELHDSEVPKKWKKYYNLLIELRAHVSQEISLHTASTLKHSSRDDSGDLSGYGNHQADAGTDSFDRDFALSLVSSEQDALNEIEQAIRRIKAGNYGVCEVTGKPIPPERLAAVPFTRYSVQGQTEYEKNLRRKTDRSIAGGLFEDSADAPKLASGEDDDD